VLSFQTRVPSGPAIILIAAILYIASLLFGRAGGVVRKLFPGRHLEA
jgi:zinc/manganese transport system permease protein